MPNDGASRSSISSRRTYDGQVSRDLVLMLRRQARSQADRSSAIHDTAVAQLAAEVEARNAALTATNNAERAQRVQADMQEGRERIAADDALAAQIAALEAETAQCERDRIAADEATAQQIAAIQNAATEEGRDRVADQNALAERLAAIEAATRLRKFAASFGNGVLRSFDFKHSFGTRDVMVQVYSTSTSAMVTPASISMPDVDTVRLTYVLTLSLNANRVVIIG